MSGATALLLESTGGAAMTLEQAIEYALATEST